nr:hypothetical protein [uncultured Cohaesibacter sp.]
MNEKQLPDLIYSVEFCDSNDNDKVVETRLVQAFGYWEACIQGHELLKAGAIYGADDFDLQEVGIATIPPEYR